MLISSDSNIKVKQVRGLLKFRKHREKERLFVVENPKVIEEYLQKHRDSVAYVLYDERNLPPYLEGVTSFSLSSDLASKLATLNQGPGWFAVVRFPEWDVKGLLEHFRYGFLLDKVSTPLNLGAIVRSAAAFSFDMVVLGPGCTDPFHPEALRGMVGTIFDVPVLSLSEKEIQDAFAGVEVSVLDAHAQETFGADKVAKKALFVLGSEGNGIQSEFISQLPGVKSYRIPMNERVESLNVASTSAILGYIVRSVVAKI